MQSGWTVGQVLTEICQYLHLKDIIALQCTCKTFKAEISSNLAIWRHIYSYMFVYPSRNSIKLKISPDATVDDIKIRLKNWISMKFKIKNESESDASDDDDDDNLKLILHKAVYSISFETVFFFGGTSEFPNYFRERNKLSNNVYSLWISNKTEQRDSKIFRCSIVDTDSAPELRCSSSFVELPSLYSATSCFVMFGGYCGDGMFANDLWVAEASKQEDQKFLINWHCLHRNSRAQSWPGVRQGHSLTYVSKLKSFILFGGGSPMETYNDIWKIKITGKHNKYNHEVTKLVAIGKPPSERAGHGACSTSNALIIFGGNTLTATCTSDVYILLVTSDSNLMWTKLESIGMLPNPRIGHSQIVIDSKLIVYGGRDLFVETPFAGCLYIGDMSNSDEVIQWKSVEDKQLPTQTGHTVILTESGTVWSFGGYDLDTKEIKSLGCSVRISFVNTEVFA